MISVNINDIIESKSILIDENIFPILKNSLSNCDYILDDLQKDLKKLDSHCRVVKIHHEDGSFSGFAIIADENNLSSHLNKQVNDLLDNYENKKLTYSSVDLDVNYLEDNRYYLNTLITRIQSKEHLEAASIKKKKINLKNKPFVAIVSKETAVFEIYGYVKDVVEYTDYIIKQQQRCIGEIIFRFKYELVLYVRASKQPLFQILNLFGEKYFHEFRNKLFAYEADVVRQKDDVIKVNFSEESLKRYSRDYKNVKINDLRKKVQSWKLVVRTVIDNFFSNFLLETIKMPFGEHDTMKLAFDHTKLEVMWVSEKVIKIIGSKEDVELFKQDLKIKFKF